MKRKIYGTFEILTLAAIAIFLIERYDINSSAPTFTLPFHFGEIIRITADVIIIFMFLSRVLEVLGIAKTTYKWNIHGLRILLYLIFIGPDIWLYTMWTFFVNTFWNILIVLLLPFLLWSFPALNSWQLTRNLGRKMQVKIVAVSAILIFTILYGYLTLLKFEIEGRSKEITHQALKGVYVIPIHSHVS